MESSHFLLKVSPKLGKGHLLALLTSNHQESFGKKNINKVMKELV
jgi:hypothetical protein